MAESLADFYHAEPALAGQHFGLELKQRIDSAIAKAV